MELIIARDYVGALEDGKKKSTIRYGTRAVSPGEPVRFTDKNDTYVFTSTVNRVTYLKAKDLTDADARKDGFKNRNELLEALEVHYPQINDNSTVTIVEFPNEKVKEPTVESN